MQSTGADFVQAAKALNAWTDDDKSSTYKPSSVSARMMLELVAREVMIVALMAADLSKGIAISQVNKDRLFEASKRILFIAESAHATR
jgi:hypothetical protein